MYVCTYVCMYACMYIYIYIDINVCELCISIHVYIYIYYKLDILFFCLRKCFWDVKPAQSDSYGNKHRARWKPGEIHGEIAGILLDPGVRDRWMDGCNLVGGLEHFLFSHILGCIHHPNWRTPIFQRGGKKTTNQQQQRWHERHERPGFFNAFLQGYVHGHHHGTWRSMASLVGNFMLLPQSMICERGTTLMLCNVM